MGTKYRGHRRACDRFRAQTPVDVVCRNGHLSHETGGHKTRSSNSFMAPLSPIGVNTQRGKKACDLPTSQTNGMDRWLPNDGVKAPDL
jgi:hypothetical protein